MHLISSNSRFDVVTLAPVIPMSVCHCCFSEVYRVQMSYVHLTAWRVSFIASIEIVFPGYSTFTCRVSCTFLCIYLIVSFTGVIVETQSELPETSNLSYEHWQRLMSCTADRLRYLYEHGDFADCSVTVGCSENQKVLIYGLCFCIISW